MSRPPAPAGPRPRRRLDRRTVTRAAFAVIVVFVSAQALWWVIFQRGYVERVTEERLADWDRDAALAEAALSAAEDPAALRSRLLEVAPHLLWRADGTVTVDPDTRAAFLERQHGILRMFAWEGPFFVLVVLGMLALIASSLRQERGLKRAQQNFLSAITHEFTTPLATLRLLVQTAQLRDLDAERRRSYLERMNTELDRLERTSGQVLAAARLEQTPDAPRLEPADLRTVVRRHLDAARPGLQARGATVRLEGADGPLPVSLEPQAFALALSNLLDNAVKYGRSARAAERAGRDAKHGIETPVTVRLEDRGHLIDVHVDDAGPGVPESDRERIFDRFWRRGDESTRSAPGTGLGLHLVRSTVEAMNGWVRVDEAPGGGARFTVTLPRRVAGDDHDDVDDADGAAT